MLKIYNTLTKKKELFKPITPNKVTLYLCGMTVYDDCHIGHARTFITFDIIVRYLKFLGFEVNFIRNITDIDDKIIKRANENGEPIEHLTKRMIDSMHEDCQALNLLQPTAEPLATQHIDTIIQTIQQLFDRGYAYTTNQGDVCFEVRKFKAYGKLSRRNVDELEAGARVDLDIHKKDPLDFVLWKKAKPGEPSWLSPWGEGRPGWHIECSSMSTKLLGQPFDIHGGGLDLKFPHHENEIAQSEGASSKAFAHYWIHSGLLHINKEKMSKSLKNFFTIKEILQKHDSEVIRYFMLTGHYRSVLQYSDEAIQNSKIALQRLYLTLRDIKLEKNLDKTFVDRFKVVMDNDFNTPEALSVLFEISHEINRLKKSGKNEKIPSLAFTLKTLGNLLGILYKPPEKFLQSDVDRERVEALIRKRQEARDKKDFKTADEIRDQLKSMGITIEDSGDKTTWRQE